MGILVYPIGLHGTAHINEIVIAIVLKSNSMPWTVHREGKAGKCYVVGRGLSLCICCMHGGIIAFSILCWALLPSR